MKPVSSTFSHDIISQLHWYFDNYFKLFTYDWYFHINQMHLSALNQMLIWFLKFIFEVPSTVWSRRVFWWIYFTVWHHVKQSHSDWGFRSPVNLPGTLKGGLYPCICAHWKAGWLKTFCVLPDGWLSKFIKKTENVTLFSLYGRENTFFF